jgi:hypothetical protein
MCADRTILSPQNANALNGLFTGAGNLDLNSLTTNQITLDSLSPAPGNTDYTINSYSNVMAITVGNASIPAIIQLTNSVDTAQIACPDNNVIGVPQLLLSDSATPVLIKPLSAPNYLGLVNPATGTNTASIQGGTFNALTSVTSPIYNIVSSNGQGNINITFVNPGNYLDITSSMYVHHACNAGTFGGGIYSDQYVSNPIRVLPPSGTSQYVFTIPWNPVANWTVDTINPIFTYVSDYPIATTSYSFLAISDYQLQITLNTSNGSGTQPTSIYSINFILLNVPS